MKKLKPKLDYKGEINHQNLECLHAEFTRLNEATVEGFDDVGYELSYIYKILTPSKHKALLDMSMKLYDDEVSRYRFLEEKANKILGFVGFLLPVYSSFVIWLVKNEHIILNCVTKASIFITAVSMIVIIFILLSSFRLVNKPYVVIDGKTINIVKKESIDTVNFHFYSSFIPSIKEYIETNKKKSDLIVMAYNLIILMYISSLCSIVSIGYNYLY